MKIKLENIGRRFNREWIFKKISTDFESGNCYAVLGPNGSGKSTLLQIVAGSLSPSEGKIEYTSKAKKVEVENVFSQISWAAPYIELIEEFTLKELIDFHFKFKPHLPGYNTQAVIELLALEGSKNKAIKFFSSGMKQRTKLALAFCTLTPVLLLDEPTSNLDTKGVDWYLELIEKFTANRLTVICSNQEYEYTFCQNRLNILDYK